MTSKVPLFVELCAGLASVSLMLQGGKYARPPVSRMGNKHGYGLALHRIMGLRPGQGAKRFLWCEPDPGCRALLHAYTDREVMKDAARIIRSWKDEEPRSLWERLRAEGPIRVGEAREAARGTVVGAWSFRPGQPESGFNRSEAIGHPESCKYPRTAGKMADEVAATPTLPATVTPDARAVDPREVARWAQVVAANRLINISGATLRNTGAGGSAFASVESGFGTPADVTAQRFENRAQTMPATVTDDARAVEPREVAREILTTAWSTNGKTGKGAGYRGEVGNTGDFGGPLLRAYSMPARAEAVPETSATITPDARPIEPADLPPGAVVYMDPPYRNSTGYGNDLPRSEVVALARRWAEAGARVYISEAEPIGALMADGWREVEITSQRIGQKAHILKTATRMGDVLAPARVETRRASRSLRLIG